MSNTYLEFVIKEVIYFLPALISNATPVVIAKFIRNRHPIDGGRVFIDKRPILGSSKTIEGFISGVLSGLLIGIVYAGLFNNKFFILYGFTMGLGSMIGDVINSFIKRRLGLRSGEPFIPMDQLSFILVAFVLTKLLGIDRICGLYLTVTDLAAIVFITLILHPLTNLIAYFLGLKKEPW